jgi:PAP2 superfamily protein
MHDGRGRAAPQSATANAEGYSIWALSGFACLLGLIAALVASNGLALILSRDWLALWILLGLLLLSLRDLGGWTRGLILDWLPFIGVLIAYDFLRGAADGLFAAHTEPQLRADEIMFGGVVPTVWLQEHLFDSENLSLHDYATFVVYLTHFLITPLCAAALWLRSRALFRRFAAYVVTLFFAGFITYLLFPAVPPWLASQHGDLEPTTRIVGVVFGETGLPAGQALFESGARYANDVAAMPSLHGAFPVLIALFFWPLARRRWQRALLLSYPPAMAFALVYSAEHYVSDILAGWLYAGAVFWAVSAILRASRWESGTGIGSERRTSGRPRS